MPQSPRVAWLAPISILQQIQNREVLTEDRLARAFEPSFEERRVDSAEVDAVGRRKKGSGVVFGCGSRT